MFPLINKLKYWLGAGAISVLGIPLAVVSGQTIALWNFNETSGALVADQVSSGQRDGSASVSVQIVSGNVMGSGFGMARNFTGSGSYVDLGEIANTKLDLKTKTEVSVEAMIYLTGNVTNPVIIFDNKQIQLQVINNKLAGFVRQSSGFKGILSPVAFSLNTPYRVGLHLKSGYLVISSEGHVLGNVKLTEPIAAAEAGATAFIGGDISSMNFSGVIDDIRLSNVAGLDTVPPAISLVSPDISVPTVNPSQNFVFSITDNLDQIDPSSIVVKLNGVVDTGFTYNATTDQLTGHFSNNMVAGKKNVIDIVASDMVGNPISTSFIVKYIKWGSGEEYVSDSDTLGLWHLNDEGSGVIKDSSSYARHGKPSGTQPVQGVIGQARQFAAAQYPSGSDGITLPPVTIPGKVFTFEAWVKPMGDPFQTQTIFDNGQFAVQRIDTGSISIIFRNQREPTTYVTAVNALPLGKFSHMKIVYDGNLRSANLVVLIDGLIFSVLDADPIYEFYDGPGMAGIGGGGFFGVIDEVRISKSIRESVNIIRGSAPNVEIGTPDDLMTSKSPNLNLYVRYSDIGGINPSKVQVKLNGVLQTSGGSFTISSTEAKGILPSAMQPGINYLEIRITGESNNQTVVQKKVFYFANAGLSEYLNDSYTMGLWHFNEDGSPNIFADSSSFNNSLTVPSIYYVPQSVPGVFGNGVWTYYNTIQSPNSVSIPGNSFTVEGWFKPDMASTDVATLWGLSGPYFNLSLGRNKTSLTFGYSNENFGNFSVQIPEVLDVSKFQHVAVVLDAAADSSNLMILVNGTVKYQRNIKSLCRTCMSNMQVHLDPYSYVDEVRISSVARKDLNIGGGRGPAVGYLETVPNSTVHVSRPSFKVIFSDEASINLSTMSLAVNGVIDTSLNKSVSGITGTISGVTALNLQNGTNEIVVKAKNQNGEESVQTFYVFYIVPGPSTPYSANANVLGLWHFDAGTEAEIVADSSGRNFNWNGPSNPTVISGVHSEALNLFDRWESMSASAEAIPPVSSWTAEAWVQLSSSGSMVYLNMENIQAFNIDSYGGVTFASGRGSAPAGTIPIDGSFHHVAVILDTSNLHRQILLVIDGTVVSAVRARDLPGVTFNSVQAVMYTSRVDEMRLSNVAQYTLNYSKPTTMIFKNARKMKMKKLK